MVYRKFLLHLGVILAGVGTIAIEDLRNSGYFDDDWYIAQYPDVRILGMDPAEHFLWIGAKLGRHPSHDHDADRVLRTLANPVADGQPDLGAVFAAPEESGALPPSLGVSGEGDAPYYGAVLHKKIELAWRRTKSESSSEAYKLVRDNFDMAYYLMRNVDVDQALQIDPVQHYLDHGAQEGRDPHPSFSTRAYVQRYSDVSTSGLNPYYHWLTIGRDEGRIATPFMQFGDACKALGRSPTEVQHLLEAKRDDIRSRFEHGKLGEMVQKAAELEPLIAHSWPEVFQAKLPPFNTIASISNIAAMRSLHEAAEFRRAKIVIAVNKARWGGARRMEGHIAHALSLQYGADQILIVSTDDSAELPPNRFPSGCRYIDFPAIVKKIEGSARERILVEFLRSLCPEAVFNVNSRLLWEALRTYGKALSASTDLHACMFCNDQSGNGFWGGYPASHFYRYFEILGSVCTDSHYLADMLKQQFQVPPALSNKLKVLEAPVDANIPVIEKGLSASQSRHDRPKVFWAGRFDRQKRVDIVYALAEKMPDVDFHLWGEAVADGSHRSLKKPDTVFMEGKYEDFMELPLENCDVWLYTSEWDGVPSILLEVAMTGIPIVGTIAGGTGEVIRDGVAWPVATVEDVDAYVRALSAVLANPELARERALGLRSDLVSRRTTGAYLDSLQSVIRGSGNNV